MFVDLRIRSWRLGDGELVEVCGIGEKWEINDCEGRCVICRFVLFSV